MTDIILELIQLEKAYGKKTVLKDINLTVPKGCCYSLLGINGAGKSTLMKIITGMVVKIQGEVKFKAQKMQRQDLKQIGSLIEGPAFYGNLSGYENLKIVALQENLSLTKIDSMLNQVGLATANKELAKNYSLGMKQRLGIAMALLKEPDLLVLDEPFNGLDPYGVEEIKTFLKSLLAAGKTIIISSHILAELENITDKVGIIHQGQIVYEKEYHAIENLKEIFFNHTKS